MKIKISYKHLEPSPAVELKIKEKLMHLKKYFNGKMNVSWVCSVDGHQQHKSELNINVGGQGFHAHAVDANLYNTLDKVLSKIEKQIYKKDVQLKEKMHKGSRELQFETPSPM